jgi:iron complex outermembrane receptor protein
MHMTRSNLLASACILAVSLASHSAFADDEGAANLVAPVNVNGQRSISELQGLATTTESVTSAEISAQVNAMTPEDTVRYMPNILVRQRHPGDTYAPITTRTSGVGASARSLIYVDGILLSSLIGNNNGSASPKWGLIAPEAVERVDVLYGPFAAAYAGNSIGAVMAFTTRMPQAFEGGITAQGSLQSFSKYGENKDYGDSHFAINLGDRFDRLAVRISYNHLDANSQPISYGVATIPGATSASGVATTGGYGDANRNGTPILVLGSGGNEHQQQNNLSGRLTYDLTPTLTAAYTFGVFRNDTRSEAASYLRSAAGVPVYTGSLNIGGRLYTVAASALSGGQYTLTEDQLAQGLSLASHTGGAFDFELTANSFDYLDSRQRTPTTALPGAASGGAGSVVALDHTGWFGLEAKGYWRVSDLHRLSFGAHMDGVKLANPKYALSNWTAGPIGALQTLSRGRTETSALWVQDIWGLTPALTATLGLRYENWRAFAGYNYAASPALAATLPEVTSTDLSPKAVLSWAAAAGWTLKASAGVANRYPTVGELYQAVTTGAQLTVPNPNLKPERATSTELSAERQWSSGRMRLSLFSETLENALLSQAAPLVPGSATLYSYVQNIDRTRANGIELVAEEKDLMIHGLELSGWVTYVDAKTVKDTANATVVGKELPQVPKLRGSIVATYRPTDKLSQTLGARYSDRSFGTIDSSDHFANTYTGFSGYFVMDARAQYQVTPHLTAGLGVNNLNDRAYFLYHPFPMRTVVADLKYRF